MATHLAPVPSTPRPHLVPVPPHDPPDDPPGDDGGWAGPAGTEPSGRARQGTLALAFTLPGGLPAEPRPSPRLRLVRPDERVPDRRGAPDPRLWGARLAQAMAEVLAGQRPAAQLLRWTSPEVHAQLVRRTREGLLVRRPVLRSLHVCEPAAGVAEACGLVRAGTRARALALRLEAYDGRWVCTALEVG